MLHKQIVRALTQIDNTTGPHNIRLTGTAVFEGTPADVHKRSLEMADGTSQLINGITPDICESALDKPNIRLFGPAPNINGSAVPIVMAFPTPVTILNESASAIIHGNSYITHILREGVPRHEQQEERCQHSLMK